MELSELSLVLGSCFINKNVCSIQFVLRAYFEPFKMNDGIVYS